MSRLRQAVFWQALASLAAVVLVLWVGRHWPWLSYISLAQHRVAALGTWGGMLYPLLYAAGNIFLLPGSTLAVGSGLFFGLWWGFLLNLLASVLAAAISFALSRWAFRRWFRARLLRHPRGAALDTAVARHGWKIVLLSQVHPLAPSSLLNYLYGVTKIPFRTCVFWVGVGQAPSAFLYAYLGTLAQLGLRLLQGETRPRSVEYIVWIGGLLLTIAVTVLLGRLAVRLLAEAEAEATVDAPSFSAAEEQASLPPGERSSSRSAPF